MTKQSCIISLNLADDKTEQQTAKACAQLDLSEHGLDENNHQFQIPLNSTVGSTNMLPQISKCDLINQLHILQN